MLSLVLICALVGSISAVPPYADGELRASLEDLGTNLDDPRYRLKDSVYPNEVFLDLDVYLDTANFTGVVRTIVEVREENLTQIVLHQKVVSINSVSVLNSANQPVALKFPDSFTTDDYFELLLINFENPLRTGQYTIIINYNGQINTNPLDRGFYRGYYHYNNGVRLYATTQFQPYHARKAFPCFDEPQFKSRYVISITRDASLSQSYSNMDINYTTTAGPGRITETFLPTPIVSSYLVAFHVSDFVATNSSSTPTKPFQIISRQGATEQHGYAADIGRRITDELDDYLGIEYYDMGQGQLMKNDHIALPDFPSGAMENWGMVNYREAYLLYDRNNTNLSNKIFIATIIAHELAHKWFGNLVTCFWWGNLWLNESFASFFEYFSAHAADPNLELDDQFVVDYVQSALSADAGSSVSAMNNSNVASNPSISGHFSTTSYAKGASVLRTLEHFVGPRTFRTALRYYLRSRAYEIGTPEDMYDAFRRATSEDFEFSTAYPGVDIGVVFDSWVQNPGSPVLNVSVNTQTGVITVTQERFLLTGTPEQQLWHIPLTWTHGNNPDFTSTKPIRVLSNQTATIQGLSGHHWVIFNIAQSGLYRVNYDNHTWEMLASYLRSSNNNRLTIHKLNRAQIVNDVLFFIRAGKIDIDRAFDVLEFLRLETDYYVWAAAIGQLDWIRRRLEHMPVAHAEFDKFLLESLNTVINNLGYDELETDSTSTILNRMQILNLACNLGHAGCISNSLQKWNSFRNNNVAVPVNLRRYVYCVGLRQGNASDYNFLLEKYNTAVNTADMVVILRALACTKVEASLQNYLLQSTNNDKIRIHDRTNAFSYALQGNPENLKIVLEFLFGNFTLIRDTYGGPDRLSVAINACAAHLTNITDIRNFQSWAYTNQLALGTSFQNGVNVVNTAMNNLQWGTDNVVGIYSSLLQRGAATSITVSITLLFVALAAHILH
ncbi:membrane alanyl aminopeptidase-like [Achroia grisella]|uniref:membrane alanyl aminopeptidase-like n=1 Tax=Achroia grisella TaxID=688607 RepID=UPI0027D30F6D|nr:membrane alanyl aminopeptidase-like [Achroia grisella]